MYSSPPSPPTHNGIEHLMVEYKNCLQQFASSLHLKVSARFLRSAFLFPNAVEVDDWNHQMAGCMKAALSSVSTWPDRLVNLRTWCRFFKDDSHRAAVAVYLCSIGEDRVAKLLSSWTASFAKWRYCSHNIGIALWAACRWAGPHSLDTYIYLYIHMFVIYRYMHMYTCTKRTN